MREIVYFDESPDSGRAAVADPRGLPEPTWAPPEIRVDPFTGESVVIAAQRQDRTYHPATADCPLDPRETRMADVRSCVLRPTMVLPSRH
jgi:UDPglucose--hexose-1-phosphate uridylyltransferase